MRKNPPEIVSQEDKGKGGSAPQNTGVLERREKAGEDVSIASKRKEASFQTDFGLLTSKIIIFVL